ncbi:MAG: acetyl-CoA carboxylase carboxyl transferase subunit alpha [Clostridia bacterium]|nr:acetyl-CoA carboxylase carboxyl transferase subunit alpha [Clostridia bacterium]
MVDSYRRVMNARSSSRALGAYYINALTDNFFELHGDRKYKDDGAIVSGIAELDGIPVTVIAMERGTTIEDRMSRNFGCPSPDGYRKALRLMKQAEKFSRPVLCIINSSGAYCGIDAEERGQGQAIADNLMEMMTLKTPIISIVAGEGGSGGALALSVADKIIMLENAVYSVISPEGCASILWKDAKRAPEASDALRLTAQDLYEFKIADEVIPEENLPQTEIDKKLKEAIKKYLKELMKKSEKQLLESRYDKFRVIGK